MKMIFSICVVVLCFSASAFADEFKGFVADSMCASKASMKGDADCAKRCIQRGTPAVLVTPEGKVYKIANQEKITPRAGENVTVKGTLSGDTITVESVN
jgi:hypothetical protein